MLSQGAAQPLRPHVDGCLICSRSHFCTNHQCWKILLSLQGHPHRVRLSPAKCRCRPLRQRLASGPVSRRSRQRAGSQKKWPVAASLYHRPASVALPARGARVMSGGGTSSIAQHAAQCNRQPHHEDAGTGYAPCSLPSPSVIPGRMLRCRAVSPDAQCISTRANSNMLRHSNTVCTAPGTDRTRRR